MTPPTRTQRAEWRRQSSGRIQQTLAHPSDFKIVELADALDAAEEREARLREALGEALDELDERRAGGPGAMNAARVMQLRAVLEEAGDG